MVITEAQATDLLRHDLARFEAAVSTMIAFIVTDNQFAALTSFAFNVGEGALAKSTMLKKLNAGDIQGAFDQFGAWTKGGGRVLPGLVRRREAERKLFLTP